MNYRETMSRLNNALNNIDFAYTVIAKKYGLTFNALMMVCLIDEKINVTQKQICDALHLPKSTVHSILLDFINLEYIMLMIGSNKKEKIVVFTTEGANHFSKVLEETRRFEDRVLASLGDDVCALLVKTVENLGQIIKQEIADLCGSGVSN